MYHLYGMSSPNVMKVVLMLEELGLPYDFTYTYLLRGGDQYSEEFKKLNPNQRVPTLIDQQGPEGKPIALFESGAILMYLAEKHGRFWPTKDRHVVTQWLMFQMASIGPMMGQWGYFTRMAPAGNEHGAARFTTEVRRLFGVLDRRLAEAEYLGGDEYSIADMCTYPWIRPNQKNLQCEHLANLDRWVKAISARPAGKIMIAKDQELSRLDWEEFSAATPDQIDRFYGRGAYSKV